MPRRVQIAMFPDTNANPYIGRLMQSLASLGAEFVGGHHGCLGLRWFLAHAFRGIVLYIHWPSEHYSRERRVVPWVLWYFLGKVLLARLIGYQVVWCCHNLLPHEYIEGGKDQRYHRLARRVLAGLCHCVVFLSERSRQAFTREFRVAGSTVIVPHGHLIGAHGAPPQRGSARQELGWAPDEFWVLVVGKVRQYKGIERLLEVFQAWASPDARLMVAGMADPATSAALTVGAAADPRIRLRLGWIGDHDLVALLSAADVVALPFEAITNSSSGILALSYGCLTVLPAAGSLSEIVPADAAVFFQPGDKTALGQVLRQVHRLSEAERQAIRSRALNAARQMAWETGAKALMGALATGKSGE